MCQGLVLGSVLQCKLFCLEKTNVLMVVTNRSFAVVIIPVLLETISVTVK